MFENFSLYIFFFKFSNNSVLVSLFFTGKHGMNKQKIINFISGQKKILIYFILHLQGRAGGGTRGSPRVLWL